jgi:spore germination protein
MPNNVHRPPRKVARRPIAPSSLLGRRAPGYIGVPEVPGTSGTGLTVGTPTWVEAPQRRSLRWLARVIALALVPCLFAHPMADNAYSDPFPAWPGGRSGISLHAWVANFNPLAARTALRRFAGNLDELSIFGVGGNSRGGLAPEQDFIDSALRSTRKLNGKTRVFLTVTNYRMGHFQDRWLLHEWLGSRKKWEHHAFDLLRLADKADGIDLDYERLTPNHGWGYSQFIKFLATELHKRGKFLTVTVEPQVLINFGIDWKTVSANADRVRVMAYQFHWEKTGPGAVSPPDIVYTVAKRALARIPKQKLEISLPLYGFDWTKVGDGRLVGNVDEYRRLANQKGAVEFRDSLTRSARVDYFVMQNDGRKKKLIRHQVWFEDATSVIHKVRMLKRMGIRNIGLWQLAVGDLTELFEMMDGAPSEMERRIAQQGAGKWGTEFFE